jgi:putative ABC transport system substrate-binding protein
MNKIICSGLSVLLFVICSAVQAQQPGRVPQIGYLAQRNTPTPTTPDPAAEAFRQGLRDLGYVERKNILVEYRYAEGSEDRLRALVDKLVQLKIGHCLSNFQGIQQLNRQQNDSHCRGVTVDPIATGLIESLARWRQCHRSHQTHPRIERKGWNCSRRCYRRYRTSNLRDADATAFKDYEIPARALKIKLQSLDVRSSKLDFEEAFQIAVKRRVNALVVVSGALSLSHRKLIADLAIKNRLPSMHERGEEVEAGGLMSYSADNYESFRRASVYVDKILKGAKPADLPVEQPTKFEFVINLKTAKQIGVTIPPNVLARADRVIK